MKLLKNCEVVIFLLAILNLTVGLLKVKRGGLRKMYNICCVLGYVVAGITLFLSLIFNIIYLPNNVVYNNYLTLLIAASATLLTFQLSSFIQGLNSFSKIRSMHILQSIIFFILCEVLCIILLLIFKRETLICFSFYYFVIVIKSSKKRLTFR